MFHNQSRAERSDSTQYRKTGRSGSSNQQQRQFSAGVSTKGGGGASSAPINHANRRCSFKKYDNNAPVGQPDAGTGNIDSSDDVHNGAHQQERPQRVPDAPGSKTSSNLKPTDVPTQKTTTPVPKSPSTPAAASKSFPFQFGSISPGFMNGMQVPARTSSAPPNFDEQKKEQLLPCQLHLFPNSIFPKRMEESLTNIIMVKIN